jgi:flagellar hook-length control protein FliK
MLSPAFFAAVPQGQASAPAAGGTAERRPDGNDFADELQAALAGGASAVPNTAPPPPPAAPDTTAPRTDSPAPIASGRDTSPTPKDTPPAKTDSSASHTGGTAQATQAQGDSAPARPASTDSSAATAVPAKTAGQQVTAAATVPDGANAAANVTLPAVPATQAPPVPVVLNPTVATVPTNIPNVAQPIPATATAQALPPGPAQNAPTPTAGTSPATASLPTTDAVASLTAATAKNEGAAPGQAPFVQQAFAQIQAAGVNGPSMTATIAQVMVTALTTTTSSRSDPAPAKAAPAPSGGLAVGAYMATQAPAGPSADAAHQAPPVAEQITGAIVAHLEVSQTEGRVDFHLRLDPPELGQVRVQLTVTEQTLTARLVARDDATRQLIQSQMDSLRQKLQETGLSLGQLDVSSGGGGRGGGQRQQALLPFPDLTGGGPTVRTVSPPRQANLVAAGRVDVVA